MLPYHILNKVMRDDFRKVMVKRALEFRKMASPSAKKLMLDAIFNRIKVNGFHDARKAPSSLLYPAILKMTYMSSQVMGAVLCLWVESHKELCTCFKEYLYSKDVDIEDNIDWTKGFIQLGSRDESIGISEEFHKMHPDFDEDDIILMFWCLTGKACLSSEKKDKCEEESIVIKTDSETSDVEEREQTEMTDKIDGMEQLKWSSWLDELQSLTPEAPEWDKVDVFLESVAVIAAIKQEQRNEIQKHVERQSLVQTAIETLIDQSAEYQDYFGLKSISLWKTGKCTHEDLEHISDKLHDLKEKLQEYRRMSLLSQRSFAEEAKIGNEIIEAYRQLDSLFLTSGDQEIDKIDVEKKEPSVVDNEQMSKAIDIETSQDFATNVLGHDLPQAKSIDELPIESLEDNDIEESVSLEERNEDVQPQSAEETAPISPESTEDVCDTGSDAITAEIHDDLQSFTPDETKDEDAVLHPCIQETSEHSEETNGGAASRFENIFSKREAAMLVGRQNGSKEWNTLLSTLIYQNDLCGAYWLSYSLGISGLNPFVPDWMIKAVLAAQWLSHDSFSFVDDLLDIAKNHQPDADDIQILMGLAAALNSTLIAPVTGLVGWLKVPACCADLRPLVKAVLDFNKLQIALHPEDLLGVAGKEKREMALRDKVSEAERWLEGAAVRTTSYRLATDVWRHLINYSGELSDLLRYVVSDKRNDIDKVRQAIEKWVQHDYAVEHFEQIARKIRGAKAPIIVGAPRQHLLNGVNEACGIARGWCELVDREKDISSRGDWLFQQVTDLRNKTQNLMKDVEHSLNELLMSSSPQFRAAAACMLHSVWKLQDLLQIPRCQVQLEADPSGNWDWLKIDSMKIDKPLNRRLLYLPTILLDDYGQPLSGSFHEIAPALQAESLSEESLRKIVSKWLDKQDYRFVRGLIEQIEDEKERAEANAAFYDQLKGSQTTLREKLAQAEMAVEQAVVDGIISDSEGRSEYSAKNAMVNPDEVLNFLPRFEELSRIQDDLQKARQDRISHLKEDWLDLQERLSASHLDALRREMVRHFVDVTMQTGNTGVVEECLAHLKEVLDTGVELEDRLFSDALSQKDRDELDEFKSLWNSIEDWLQTRGRTLHDVASDLLAGRLSAQMKMGDVPKKRREEASSAILAWQKLKQQRTNGRFIESALEVLRYLGFSAEEELRKAMVEEKHSSDWAYFRAAISISDLAKPIPQFGSQARGRYDIICLWERPGVDSIAARIRELNLNLDSVIVLYLGRMTERQRRDMVRIRRDKELAIALLDETLLIFLAQERDARFPVFLRCTLPFAALNPYTPFQAGDVPTEMFFGRSSMSRELQRATGSCLVYGGRQLGKSALLRYVQRLFDNPGRDQHAWIENTKLVFDPQAGKSTSNLWRGLREAFISRNLLSSRKTSDKPEEIRRYIMDSMEAEGRRVIVMFDEADDFLDADANDNFRIVTALRELMLETERRFKVIFAGLHNVQRFQGIPDQPLAHFGAPLCVGPLEPAAARQLVLEPLTTLGYRLDNATVLRILSYTNYHPGLIQFFCQEILKRLHSNWKNALPPYEIQQSDVEAVYRIQEVRERIKERFDWTLALDIRYQAIAWAMIENQMKSRDSYALPYTPADILRMASSWWSQGFRNVNMDKLRSLLDEMCGLGVLVRNSNGYFRLRSPNLVRLMGTDTDIYSRLEELVDRQPPTPFTADSYHAHLDEKAQLYSPLTYSQARSLNLHKFGVGMIFASDAMGFPYLAKALDRFVTPESIQVEHCVEIPGHVWDPQAFRRWLNEHLQSKSQYERLVVYIKMGSQSCKIQIDLVQEAMEFCRRHQKSRKQWVRIIFLFDFASTWTWLSQPVEARERIENSVDAIVIPQRWDAIAVRQRLEQHQKMHSDRICNRILDVTGGWPFLLDHLFQLSEHDDDPSPRIIEVEQQLILAQSSLGEKFYGLLELENFPKAFQVLSFMIQESEVPQDLIEEPDLIPSVSSQECKQIVECLLRMNCLELKENLLTVEATVRKVIEGRC